MRDAKHSDAKRSTSYRANEHDHIIDRSSKYQYLLREISWPDENLVFFSNEKGITAHLQAFYQYNENVAELKDKLLQRIWILAEKHFTKKQYEIFTYMMDGYTQVEIAEKLNLGQSTITKVVNGSHHYEEGKKTKRYGGFMPKLRRLAQNDEVSQTLIKEIEEFQQNIL